MIVTYSSLVWAGCVEVVVLVGSGTAAWPVVVVAVVGWLVVAELLPVGLVSAGPERLGLCFGLRVVGLFPQSSVGRLPWL